MSLWLDAIERAYLLKLIQADETEIQDRLMEGDYLFPPTTRMEMVEHLLRKFDGRYNNR